jgi:hypothetical protein
MKMVAQKDKGKFVGFFLIARSFTSLLFGLCVFIFYDLLMPLSILDF